MKSINLGDLPDGVGVVVQKAPTGVIYYNSVGEGENRMPYVEGYVEKVWEIDTFGCLCGGEIEGLTDLQGMILHPEGEEIDYDRPLHEGWIPLKSGKVLVYVNCGVFRELGNDDDKDEVSKGACDVEFIPSGNV